jgi:hypothetical protein
VAGGFIIAHQLALIVSGNYSWLNWLTVILGLAAFSDPTLALGSPALAPRPLAFDTALGALSVATALLSIQPTLNLFSKHQKMNYSWNPLHLVGSYGAFGSVTRRRYEIAVEGTDAEMLSQRPSGASTSSRASPATFSGGRASGRPITCGSTG